MKMQKTLMIVAIVLSLGIAMPGQVFAEDVPDARRDFFEAKQEVKEERKDFFGTMREKTNQFVRKVVSAGKAAIVGGTITAKSDTTLTIEKDGKSYTVHVSDNTQLRRRFWGKSSTAEFSVGNTVNVYGAWTDDTQTAINARLIRNISIQKRFAVFVGEVKSLLSGGWVMSTASEKRPDQTVTVSAETKFENRKGETIGQADVQVGHKVRVKGLWDSSSNTVTEVVQVKDFSLPAQASLPVVSVTSTATATPTP
jgi:sRNA-binding protein